MSTIVLEEIASIRLLYRVWASFEGLYCEIATLKVDRDQGQGLI